METRLLHCFVVSADELHFGRAAQRLEILPSALARNIRILEEGLGVRLFVRTTRNVELTKSGQLFLAEIRPLLRKLDETLTRVRVESFVGDKVFRIGSIDSAAAGLVPQLVREFRASEPDLELILVEDKSARLLPKLLSGALDIAFVRPPAGGRDGIKFAHLLKEQTMVVVPRESEYCQCNQLTVHQLKDLPLIYPSARNRPHSYHLINNLFQSAGLTPNFVQQADEKQTIINLVAEGVGLALLPHLTAKMEPDNVLFLPLVDENGEAICELELAAAWIEGVKDNYQDLIVNTASKILSNNY